MKSESSGEQCQVRLTWQQVYGDAHIPRSETQGIFRQAWINSLERGFGLLTQSVLFAVTPLPKRIS